MYKQQYVDIYGEKQPSDLKVVLLAGAALLVGAVAFRAFCWSLYQLAS